MLALLRDTLVFAAVLAVFGAVVFFVAVYAIGTL